MITHVSITDYATIEHIEVDFHEGLNIVTGETGAGKSVVIGAISLALGARADTTYVRTGAEKATVSLLAEKNGHEIHIVRDVYASGKSQARLDGDVISLGELQKIALEIADIHGQYDQQYLLNPANHILLLDRYAKESIGPAKETVATLYEEYRKASLRLKTLESEALDSDRRKEQMEYEIADIEAARLSLGEDERLSDALKAMQHQEEIASAVSTAYDAAKGGGYNALDALNTVLQELQQAAKYSEEAKALTEEAGDLYYRLDDLAMGLRQLQDGSSITPEEIDETSDRLYLIERLKKKYGGTVETVLQKAKDNKERLTRLVSLDEEIAKARADKDGIRERLAFATDLLTDKRKKAALSLQQKIAEEMIGLNFVEANVELAFAKKDDFTPDGKDEVVFMLSANRGEALKPLSKIASGGEMSRIMLAFKTVMAAYDGIPTMIFDEIDAGISGETAILVGRAIKNLATDRQIVTITHLPQIAAFGEHSYRIEKSSDEAATYTTICALTEEEKAREIARLIGGDTLTDAALENAKEMIAMAK